MLTLQVSLERFIDEVRRRMPGESVFLTERSSDILLTAASPERSLRLVAFSALARSEVEMKLGQAALDFANGVWRSDDEVLDDQAMQDYYVAAVAYRSSEHKPGVWIDAYPHEPNVQEVLQNLYEEFDENGEIADVSFDDFLRLAVPNVEILGPDQTRYFVRRKSEA